jgi:hypothetical protein
MENSVSEHLLFPLPSEIKLKGVFFDTKQAMARFSGRSKLNVMSLSRHGRPSSKSVIEK